MSQSGARSSELLVERERERSALIAAIEDARAGRGRVVAIEAVAGAGKTSLLDLADCLATERRLRVLRARGTEMARDVPLALLRDLMQRRLAAMAPADRAAMLEGPAAVLAGALGLADPQPISDRVLHHAAQWLVADMASLEPLVLLVDDLHWGDPTSVAALAAIGSRLDELPVALILTHRPGDHDAAPRGLSALSLAADVRLYPDVLTRTGVATVLRARLGRAELDERIADIGFAATGGSPFLVVQLAAALVDTDTPLDAGELADLGNAVSRALTSVLRMRVGRLGPDAVAVAQAVVTLGDDCAIAEACAVADVSRERCLRAAAALAGAGVFARDRITAFAHPLVRAAIDGDLVAADKARLEERAVEVLLASAADASRTAEHLLRTAPASDPRAVDTLRVAALAASASAAPKHAAVLLRRALAELPGQRPPAALLDQIVAAELAAGDFERAGVHIRARLAAGASPARRADLIRWLGRAVMQTDGIPAAVALLDDEIAHLEGDGRLLVEAEQAWMCMLHPPFAGRLQAPVAAHAQLAGDAPGQRAMLAMVGLAMSLAPGSSSAVVTPIVTRAFGDGALLADQTLDGSAHAIAAYALLLTEQFELVESEMTLAAEEARRSGASGLTIALALRAMARLSVGRLGDAEADGLAAIESGIAAPGALNDAGLATAAGVVADVRAERGDDPGAMGVLAECGLVGDLGGDPELRALLPRARAHLAAGRAADALADARRAELGFKGYQDVRGHSAVVESLAHRALGNRDAAIEAGSAQLRRARAWGTPSYLATALRVTGLALGGVEGLAMLDEAVSLMQDSPALIESANCLLALGMLRRRSGRRRAALDALRRAADLAQRIGARRVAGLARDEMVVLGARPRRLAFTGADALTAAERRVAQLAAVGRTNREIAQELYVSSKTVETHLAHAYAKLAITSRGQLAAALRLPRTDAGS